MREKMRLFEGKKSRLTTTLTIDRFAQNAFTISTHWKLISMTHLVIVLQKINFLIEKLFLQSP